MGSVKDLVTDPRTLAGKLYIPAQPHRFGQGAWKVSGRFSVADLKNLIPPVEIKDKGALLAMMAGAYFEHAANQGFPSHYLGMMDKNGRIVSTTVLLTRGEVSDIIVTNLANTPKGKSEADLQAYHDAIARGDISVYVADAESIFRAGFPLGSSSFKKMFELTGHGDEYEKLATYDDTVAVLDRIRAEIAATGWTQFPRLRAYLDELTLIEIPNPGQTIKRPILNFTTKFKMSGDEDVTEEEARERMHVSSEEWENWKALMRRCADDQIRYSKARDIVNIDGKVEAVVAGGAAQLADVACTPDENRLMLTFERGGIPYLLPTNKEMQRAMFRAEGIYAAIDAAKAEARNRESTKDNWQNYLFNHIPRQRLEDVARASCEIMGDALRTLANRALGKEIFDARPMQQWVGPFLPYASRIQPAATFI